MKTAENLKFNHLRSLTLVSASVLLSLCLVEIGLRFVPPDLGKLSQLAIATNDARGYAPRPHSVIHFTGLFSSLAQPVVWQINPQGFRAAQSVEPYSDRFRIATFGDSETFGWSVNLPDTFQKQMEAIDSGQRVEVLNFGVPGYNVSNIADHIELYAARFHPQLILYLVNKNDFDLPIRVNPFVVSSALLMRLRLVYQITLAKPHRIQLRHSAARAAVFAHEIERIVDLCLHNGFSLLLGFLKWKNTQALASLNLQTVTFQPQEAMPKLMVQSDPVQIVDVQRVIQDLPKEDQHLSKTAHRKMAALFCHVISGAPGQQCVPHGWMPNDVQVHQQVHRQAHQQIFERAGLSHPD